MKKYLLLLIFILLLTFTLIGNCTGWLSGGWDQRIKLTIDNTKVDAALSDFPVTIFFTSTQAEEIFTEFDADADYMKCAFTTSNGTTQLYAEKELFDDSAQKAIYHVKVTSVASGADTDIYYYYDNDHADNTTYIGAINTTAGATVWDSNFKAVYHMVDATTSTVVDSTSNNHDGTKVAANKPIEDTGKVSKAQHFNPSDTAIEVANHVDLQAPETVMLLFKLDTWIESQKAIFQGDSGGNYWLMDFRNNYIRVIWDSVDNGGDKVTLAGNNDLSAPDTNWHQLGFTRTATNLIVYYDGAEEINSGNNDNLQDPNHAYAMQIGRRNNDTPTDDGYFDGYIDEIRISNSVRNAAWIKAEYNSLWDSLLTYGSEESSSNAVFFGCNF